MDENDTLPIRRFRAGQCYFVDDAIIANYGRIVGPYGIAVYSALCYHANLGTQRDWPSHATLAEEIGCGRRTVIRAIKQLKGLGLITKEERPSNKMG